MKSLAQLWLIIVLLLSGCGTDPKTESVPPSDSNGAINPEMHGMLAVDVVGQFLSALVSADTDELMSTSEVPFQLDGTVVSDRDNLQAELAKMCENEDADELAKLMFTIEKSVAFQTFSQDELEGQVGEFLKGNLEADDQLVTAQTQFPGKRPEKHLFYVRIRDGREQIVGWRDMR